MKLKKHREDVETLKHLAVSGRIGLTVMSIADRYKRMILAYEAYIERITFLYGPVYSVKEKRVLKDAEVKK